MPYYVEINSKTYSKITANSGNKEVAGRLSNTNTSCAGSDFCFVYDFSLQFQQPHDEVGGGNHNAAPFIHVFTVRVPDYEPLISTVFNVLNNHDVIDSLVLNATKREGSGKEQITQQYNMQNGILVEFSHVISDQRNTNNLKHRGEVSLTFKFQSLQVEDNICNTSGTATTNTST